MIQTYRQKMEWALEDIKANSSTSSLAEVTSPLNLLEYHQIISRNNVTVSSLPNFLFDAVELQIINETEHRVDKLEALKKQWPISTTEGLFLSVATKTYQTFEELEMHDDSLYFFYSVCKLPNGLYRMRFTQFPMKVIEKSLRKKSALQRIALNSQGDLNQLRSYVNSLEYEKDYEASRIPDEEILKEAYFEWKKYTDSRLPNALAGIPTAS